MHCTDCGELNPDHAKFCVSCGHAIKPPGEDGSLQRILTLVFIDLVGSTRLADTQGLENYDSLLKRFHGQCAEHINEYGGTVLQLYGDGVLACFGLSEDSENSALGAVAACLALVDAIPKAVEGLQVRAGVHSGTVICRVDEGGQLLPQVSGLDVNIASRVQAEAEPGGVVATARTLDFLERIAKVSATDRGLTALKGVSEPLRLFDLKSYLFNDTRREAGLLFEREELLKLLSREVREETAEDESSAASHRVTVLKGSPGIGKSALLSELARRLSNRYRHLDLSARINLRHTPLFPVAEWLSRELHYPQFPLGKDASLDELNLRLHRVLPDFPEEQQRLLADVLGLADSSGLYGRYTPTQIRGMRVGALVEFVAALMAKEPLLLTFDDFHWVDEDSRAFIDRLLDRGIPRLSKIIISSRPDSGLTEYAEWRGLQVIHLEPLSPRGAMELLNKTDLAAAEKDRIVSLAEGNPLFLKTLLNLVEREGANGANKTLPPTIDATFQGVINSYAQSKELILLAAIIGRRFSMNELRYLSDDQNSLTPRFGELVRDGLMEPQRSDWQFSHILMQEAAYNMLPASRRRALHKRLADALVANEPQRVAEFPELIADHYLNSGDLERIASSCLQAGVSFLRRTGLERAQHYLQHAVTALKEAGDTTRIVSALMPLAAAKVQRYGYTHQETVRGYEELEEAVSDAEEHSMERIQALSNVFSQRIMSGNVRGSRMLVGQLESAVDTRDTLQEILWLCMLCAQELYSGHFKEALQASGRVRALYDKSRHGATFLTTGSDPLVGVVTAEANVYALRNQQDKAAETFAQAQTHVESIGAELQKPWVLIFTGCALVYCPEVTDLALTRIKAGCDLADAQGAAFWSLNGRIWQSVAASESGHPESGNLQLSRLIEQQEAMGIGLNRPLFLSVQAQDLACSGKSAEAIQLARVACRLAASTGQRQWASEIWRKRACIHWRFGEEPQARRCWRVALTYAQRSEASLWEARCTQDMREYGIEPS